MPQKKVLTDKKTKKHCSTHHVLIAVMYVVVILIIILSFCKLWLITKQYNNLVDKNTYQVVFLDNGESYFGQLENIGFKNYKLSDVYYLKYFPKLQEQEGEQQQDYELKLIQLGDQEFYKPVGDMIINKDKIIHWENLQTDSEVMNFISSSSSL